MPVSDFSWPSELAGRMKVTVLAGASTRTALGQFLSSHPEDVDALPRGRRGLVERQLVYPGHPGASVEDHEEALRLAEALHSIGDRHDTVRAVAERMTWTSPWSAYGPFDWLMAMRETFSHLLVLEQRGAVRRLGQAPLRWAVA